MVSHDAILSATARICARDEVGFVERPCILKFGGHDDQLSRRHWGMDRFRISALEKILKSNVLSAEQRRQTAAMLAQKSRIVASGAAKRGRDELARHYYRLHDRYARIGLT